MAVQLILKNSAIQDKEATAAQLAVGEIALNYYESGPFLQCKDTNGDVWRLGGVVISSTAPAAPSKGTWWLDSDDSKLRFYNGTSWIEIQTGEITVGDIAEGTARQLLQTNAAGTATEWTSNIDVPGTLDVTGVATFDNNVIIEGNLTVNGTTTTIDTETILVKDKNIEMGVVATPTDTTADGGGITLKGATDKTINWVNSTDAWTSSERFDFPAGTAAAPSIILNGDVNSGIYQPGADQVAVATNGVGRLFVDASGLISAGTGTPADAGITQQGKFVGFATRFGTSGQRGYVAQNGDYFLLTANRNPSGTWDDTNRSMAELGMQCADGGSNIYFKTAAANNTIASERLRITSAGLVGIGTSQPVGQTYIAGPNTSNFGVAADAALNIAAASGALANRIINLNFAVVPSATNAVAAIGMAYGSQSGFGNGHLIFGTRSVTTDTAPTERMRIDSSGRLGIGTSTITEKLTLICNDDASAVDNGLGIYRSVGDDKITINAQGGAARFVADGGSSYMPYRITQYDGTTLREAVHIDSSGNVGIGTASPSQRLNLSIGGDQTWLQIDKSRASDEAMLQLVHTAGNRGSRIRYANADSSWTVGIDGSESFVFTSGENSVGAGGTERARIDSNGRLLVGTTSTSSNNLFVVAGTTNGNPGFIHLQSKSTTPGATDQIGGFNFGTANDTTSARIIAYRDSGTWTPGSSTPTALTFSTTANGASTPTERMRITSRGETALHVDANSSAWYVATTAGAGTTYATYKGAHSSTGVFTGTVSFQVFSNGNVQNTNNSYTAISDIKLKENIADANSQWDDIKSLQVRSYNLKEGQTHRQIGLIAQEVEPISPGLVYETPDRDEDGNDLGTVTKSVQYSVLYMKAVKALQEAMERIEQLEANNADLLARVTALEAS